MQRGTDWSGSQGLQPDGVWAGVHLQRARGCVAGGLERFGSDAISEFTLEGSDEEASMEGP